MNVDKIPSPIVTVQNVYKSYRDVEAVKSLSFSVVHSTCFGFLGPNGAGKTTLLKMLYGKCIRDKHPDTNISVFGFDPLKDELKIKYLAGVVPQDNNLDVELNVEQNLLMFAKFYGMSDVQARSRINELLEFMELTEKKSSKIKELSGGMQRRLIIARALLNNPRLLILDEPTTGLDPQVRHLIWDKLRQLKKRGVTILLTTHYMEEAFQICDQILIMNNGEKVVEGNPQNLLQKNIEGYVLELYNLESLSELDNLLNEDHTRQDKTEERTLIYSDDIGLLKQMTDKLKAGEYFLRQANLEDLFLKATGRGLNEG